jgi:hypothetical protein
MSITSLKFFELDLAMKIFSAIALYQICYERPLDALDCNP